MKYGRVDPLEDSQSKGRINIDPRKFARLSARLIKDLITGARFLA